MAFLGCSNPFQQRSKCDRQCTPHRMVGEALVYVQGASPKTSAAFLLIGLDEQLFGTFSACYELLRQTPVQAKDRKHVRDLLAAASGGVIFTTIQKFAPEKGEAYPLLSDRRNIIVIADEAHRSQYDFIDGFARHMRDGLNRYLILS